MTKIETIGEIFPIKLSNLKKINKILGNSLHSFRRTAAITASFFVAIDKKPDRAEVANLRAVNAPSFHTIVPLDRPSRVTEGQLLARQEKRPHDINGIVQFFKCNYCQFETENKSVLDSHKNEKHKEAIDMCSWEEPYRYISVVKGQCSNSYSQKKKKKNITEMISWGKSKFFTITVGLKVQNAVKDLASNPNLSTDPLHLYLT